MVSLRLVCYRLDVSLAVHVGMHVVYLGYLRLSRPRGPVQEPRLGYILPPPDFLLLSTGLPQSWAMGAAVGRTPLDYLSCVDFIFA